MVEVFKTNVREQADATRLLEKLAEHLPYHKINFDLQDCDKVLRVEGDYFLPCRIIDLLQEEEYICIVLE
ncbi:MAG TPA: hypothetical protein VHB48_18295 [Chitinophagaceae bacterium]|jgi:hypothetical protein|nr:hypothetical protein [Chitinophagaceae bacterium]